MRKNIHDFAGIVSATLPVTGPIYEFGSFQVPGQAAMANLRPLFPGKEYVGCDMREGPGVDRILNLHAIDLPPGSAGTVLCFDTLEHVEHPHKALEEIHRILKPDGMAVISSVMNFPIHDYPYDYWRFTPEAFNSILKPFPHSFTGFQGSANFPHTVVGIGFKGNVPPLAAFRNQYEKWMRADRTSVEQWAIKLTPPILLPSLTSLYKTVSRLRRRPA